MFILNPKTLITNLILFFGYILYKRKRGYHYVPNIYGRSYRKMRDFREDRFFFKTAKKVIGQKKTLLYYDRLYYIYQSLLNVRKHNRDNEKINILEVGVYKGGSSYFIANISEMLFNSRVKIYCVDTFQGHSSKDLIQGNEAEHYPENFSDTDYNEVKNYLKNFRFAQVVKGRIQDVAKNFSRQKFHMIHLDTDLYEPTYFS